jgi:predicted CxxxxCH...CXXCH cytochrome family protein
MTHLYNTKWSAEVSCEECHIDFNGFDDPLHIGPNPDGIAEITFGTLAKDTNGGLVPDPQWNRSNATCSDSYCHGKFVQGNQSAAAIWTQSSSVVCGSCHGDPNTLNPTPRLSNGQFVPPHFSFMTQTSCYVCHGTVINSSGVFVDKTKHVNGQVDF